MVDYDRLYPLIDNLVSALNEIPKEQWSGVVVTLLTEIDDAAKVSDYHSTEILEEVKSAIEHRFQYGLWP